MPKVRRTKIIIEETSSEETSTTRVFVNGEKYQEIDFTDDNKNKKSTSKKITKKKTNKNSTKAKSKTSAKKESSTKAPKTKSNTKKKTSTSKSKKKTSTKASTKKKDTDVKKEEAKEITQLENKDKATTQEFIELPLVSEDKDKNNEENNGDSEVKVEKKLSSAENLNENDENDGGKVDSKNDKEGENKEPDNNELKESVNNKLVDTNNIPILLNDNSLAPLDSSNNKETIDNPEIIDGTRKIENEVKVKDQNLDALEAEIVEKEKLDNKKEQEKKETEESKVTQKEENAKSSKDKSTTIKENKEETKLKTENDTKTVSEVIDIPNKEETSTKANAENEKDTSTSNEIKENQGEEKLQEKSNDNVTYTYVAQKENIKENDDSFKSKLKETFFSKKGLIIGGLILVVLIAILVPVSINLSNKEGENDNRTEINESDILKENFISAENFFNRLTSLEFSFRDYRSETPTLTTELTYSFKDDIYSFNLASNVYYPETQENAKTIDTLEYDPSQNNYLLTTTTIGDTLNIKDKKERCTKNQAKDYLKSVIANFYDNYLSYNAISVQSILDEVSKEEYNEIKYYINSETNFYIIEDKSQSLRIVIDENGINTWTRYTTGSGICIPESSSDPAMLLYEINTDYELN